MSALNIRDGFSGRTLFMTGGTGFVGKVMLYKLLSVFRDLDTIYILMRGKYSRQLKRHLSPQERLEQEVLSSACFDPLRNEVGPERWKELSQKVKPIVGDITHDHLGISDSDRTRLHASVQFIIHLAATVNFNEKLNLSVQMNTLGSLRVLSFAKNCTRLESMVHVSTCYVNYQQYGRDKAIEETIFPLPFDSTAMCQSILGFSEGELAEQTKRLLTQYEFPNTYTFTKRMGEELILKNKNNVPLAIVRPSIIGCSYKDPFPGWVDALTAAGGLVLTSGLGVVREIFGEADMIADLIPVDYVVNGIILALFKTQQFYATVRNATTTNTNTKGKKGTEGNVDINLHNAERTVIRRVKDGMRIMLLENGATNLNTNMNNKLITGNSAEDALALKQVTHSTPFIYQVATSSCLNFATWSRIRIALLSYLPTDKKLPKGLAPFDTVITNSRLYYLFRYYFYRQAPYHVFRILSSLPEPLGSEKKRTQVQKLGRALRRAALLNREFYHFMNHEWVFSAEQTRTLSEGLSDEMKAQFLVDPYCINWTAFFQLYMWGMMRFIVRDTTLLNPPKVPEYPPIVFQRASSL